MVFILLCISLATVFILIVSDFILYHQLKTNYKKLNYGLKSDAISHIANRQRVDEVISKYTDKELPDGVACIMILLTSLFEVNKKSRNEGNQHIRNFSLILKRAAENKCFVGRNGGNVFIAIFENTSQAEIDSFCEQIDKDTRDNNSSCDSENIHYQIGIAFKENPPANSINELISLAYERAKNQNAFLSPHEVCNDPVVFRKQNIPSFAYVIIHKTNNTEKEEENDYKSFDVSEDNYKYTKEEILMAYEGLKEAG